MPSKISESPSMSTIEKPPSAVQFDHGLNFGEIEEWSQKFWKEKKCFESNPPKDFDATKDNQK